MATPDETTSQAVPKQGTVLAFDFGERRIGVAVGDWSLRLAHPLATIDVKGRASKWEALTRLLAEWRPMGLVVGLPRALDGREHHMSELARRFARQLEGRYNLPVALVDERLSSRMADLDLREAGQGGRLGKAQRDQAAARIILQSHFDEPERVARS